MHVCPISGESFVDEQTAAFYTYRLRQLIDEDRDDWTPKNYRKAFSRLPETTKAAWQCAIRQHPLGQRQ